VAAYTKTILNRSEEGPTSSPFTTPEEPADGTNHQSEIV